MSIRIKHRVWIQAAEDEDMKNKLFGLDSELSEVISDGFEKSAGGKFSVGASSNKNLTFGDITSVKGIMLKADGDAKIKINGITTQIQMRREPDAGDGDYATFFIEADISSINIENPSITAALNGIFCVWGDPTP